MDEKIKIKSMSPQLLVTDIDRSIGFYTTQLGFNLDFRYDDFYAGISKDGFSIHLKSGTPAPEERENRKKNEHLDITFSISPIEEWYEDLKNKQVNIIQPLRQMPYGKEFYISDLDGHIIAFVDVD